MKHKHHIIPKHMGGTDDPDNLVELTEEEHIQAHKDLYEKYGRRGDLWAVHRLTEGKGVVLSGDKNPMADPEVRAKHKLAMEKRKGENNHFYGKKHSEESKQKMSKIRKKQGNFRKGRPHTEETKNNIRKGVKRWLHRKDSDLHPSALAD